MVMRRSLLQASEKLIEDFGGEAQIAVILRSEGEIQVRDNSGVEGLAGEPLMQKTIAVMDELFPHNTVISKSPENTQTESQSRRSLHRLDMRRLILDYEIRSSWWASFVGFAWAQNLAGSYFGWKVRRKFARW